MRSRCWHGPTPRSAFSSEASPLPVGPRLFACRPAHTLTPHSTCRQIDVVEVASKIMELYPLAANATDRDTYVLVRPHRSSTPPCVPSCLSPGFPGATDEGLEMVAQFIQMNADATFVCSTLHAAQSMAEGGVEVHHYVFAAGPYAVCSQRPFTRLTRAAAAACVCTCMMDDASERRLLYSPAHLSLSLCTERFDGACFRALPRHRRAAG